MAAAGAPSTPCGAGIEGVDGGPLPTMTSRRRGVGSGAFVVPSYVDSGAVAGSCAGSVVSSCASPGTVTVSSCLPTGAVMLVPAGNDCLLTGFKENFQQQVTR